MISAGSCDPCPARPGLPCASICERRTFGCSGRPPQRFQRSRGEYALFIGMPALRRKFLKAFERPCCPAPRRTRHVPAAARECPRVVGCPRLASQNRRCGQSECRRADGARSSVSVLRWPNEDHRNVRARTSIAPRLENADCFRRWLPAGYDGACLKWAFEPLAGPRTSAFATIIQPASTLARPAHDPDRCG